MTKPTEPLRAEHRDLLPHVAELRTVAPRHQPLGC
jgi:hypothetical protein